ncbi:DUF6928 family protein [Rugamonas rivuli]|uniref:Uncharacterized protein n=1 Tax=Rugamonas rivuli TaxID=2743358 RepID=A0A843SBW3_9BURK|nr:hypothetical protein [Rugamonas rivuli]MQA18197.1 hypothetical protein [Rugamonas rivuli]
MGLSTAGVAFKPDSFTPGDEQEMIRRAFGSAFHPIPASEIRNYHDIRVPGNIAVESKNGATFIYNGELAERVLFEGQALEPALLSALGSPEVIVVFCHYDSGGSFGYAIWEKGVRVRSRVHTLDKTSDDGVPMELELPWLQAEQLVDEDGELAYRNMESGEIATEAYVTARMLGQVMDGLFGVAPWDEWDYKTKFNYYLRRPEEAAKQAPGKSWWKIW